MIAGQEKRTKKETPSAKELQKKMRWLLNYWTKLLIADWNGKGQALRVWSNSQPVTEQWLLSEVEVSEEQLGI